MKKNTTQHNILNRLVISTITSFGVLPALAMPPSSATPTPVSPLNDGDLKRATEMIGEKNFTGALDQLRSINLASLQENDRQQVAFLIAQTAFMRGDASCVDILDNFASSYPASPHTLEAQLLAADYFFFNKDFAEALVRYQDLDFKALDPGMRCQYTYRLALSMTKRGFFREARPLFQSLTGNPVYGLTADYYLAYLDYVEGNYDEAYSAFSRLPEGGGTKSRRGNRAYVSDGIEPGYYMTQIEFLREQYQDVIRHGRALIEKRPVEELLPETYRVVGESYYRTGVPDVARQYLEEYVDMTDSPNHSGAYTLGVILYDDGDFKRTAELMAPICDSEGELAQGAWFYIGQCAVKERDDNKAAIAFEKAYKLDYDSNVTEKALYNHITSLLRGGNLPFSRSSSLLKEYIQRFPSAPHSAKVRETLAEAYCRQGEYAKALEYINAIKSPSKDALRLKQQALFFLGVEEMSNGLPSDAATHLREAADMNSVDNALATQATLWLGDALYAGKLYGKASTEYEKFLKAGPSTPNYDLALYNLAYSLYQQDKFAKAAQYFLQAANASSLSGSQRANARLRRADCLFYSRDFKGAREAYQQVISNNDPGADYASLRHATLRGLLGDVPGKLKELQSLANRYPGSDWDAAALLEQGATYYDQGDVAQAEIVYRQLTEQHNDRPEARTAGLRLAQTLRGEGRIPDAIEAYENVISEWPSSEEAVSAHQDVISLHATQGSLEDYAEWLTHINGAPRISVDEMEKLEFDAAEDAFSEDVNNYTLLERYVDKYPDGAYIARALYDIADAKYEKRDFSGAVSAIDSLLDKRPDSPVSGPALLLKGEILENHRLSSDSRKQAYDSYAKATSRGNKDIYLPGLQGMMRTSDSDSEILSIARKIQSIGGEQDAMEEAAYYEAEALIRRGHSQEGTAILRRLAGNPADLFGAKAAVALAEWQLRNKQYKNAEKTLVAFTDSGTPHNYWLARGFILLADVYEAQNKKYLAKEYLQSLKENYPGDEPDITEMIDKRLKNL